VFNFSTEHGVPLFNISGIVETVSNIFTSYWSRIRSRNMVINGRLQSQMINIYSKHMMLVWLGRMIIRVLASNSTSGPLCSANFTALTILKLLVKDA
jgi:hypothetical protein